MKATLNTFKTLGFIWTKIFSLVLSPWPAHSHWMAVEEGQGQRKNPCLIYLSFVSGCLCHICRSEFVEGSMREKHEKPFNVEERSHGTQT